ncbi:MAG: exodeoxyribonuclease VII small subunit [Acidimicrobiaceae bacterium]|jgi:exodeoxyribonuclease VII small subunit|nr:exodeoxyribonuclease VII small subunit [bacterium]MCO4832899.1 exodeoxyribonuclease VII small subunit [Acidimicrobiaceae bacterium]MDB9845698.1 exodeoxyribonuclease VII small subunit [Acidimicrobiales bacterium]
MTDPADTALDDIGYADAVAELDRILDQLDDDGIDIDVLSELVERAAHLITVCRGRISAAQQQVAGIVQTLETEISP